MFRSLVTLSLLLIALPLRAASLDPVTVAEIDNVFARWRLDSHVPGLVYGIVADGKLVHAKGLGVRDLEAKRPVDLDSRFRIASMSKAFTALAILKLRDEGKLSLDAPAENYVPEMRGWTYPTSDARRITVRDLLNHSAGFVDDNPWGDRQQSLPEQDFTAMLKAGVPFSRPAGLAMEYSNFGYATLGRIIANVSGQSYQAYIGRTLLRPLGMDATGYDIAASPRETRAIGYRWQDGGWLREPDMADGAFGAMGGMETTANDYARWVAFLLSAWPPRDGADTGPVPRATVRAIAEGSNFATGQMRNPTIGAPCRQAVAYGMGWRVLDDCDLGRALTHTGGYPGYGSVVILLPEKGIGIFAFASRTYAAPSVPAFRAALALEAAGSIDDRAVPVSPGVAAGYEAVRAIWAAGDVMVAKDRLAMNVLMDRDAPHWRAELARLRAEVGACAAGEPVTATTAMAGSFGWTCEHGRIDGSLLLAPTGTPAIQELKLGVAAP
ncbi:serine hydrolase domain-containing protein [Rhizorhabdus dicambivorans]|uniref:Penicillin-binding protein n=1 Tax=Rhizorhabdus dicambivorans TaxID=1850238 RepID=A0A2A4FWY9_9SPHN|nr:serine hydrolase domain-containing protein [Rhizorhabdus dicambivorans]ATE66926.1 penicillin-binding protein [Rhizorhabdus dicambivorans]PCE42204.1 penicillin-binding protein [Rhizorhabdus dicambivorans]